MSEKDKKGLFGLFRKKEEEDQKSEVKSFITADIDKAKADMVLKQKEVVKKKKAMEVKKHTVVAGDTLSAISKKYYDDAKKYMKI